MNALIAVFMLLATTLVSAQTVPAAALTWQRTLIREAQSTIGVSAPAATLAGQLHQESGWRSDARSAVGAQGLAQFMPATAEWIAQVKPKRLSPVNPLDPRWSIMAQMEFMAVQRRRRLAPQRPARGDRRWSRPAAVVLARGGDAGQATRAAVRSREP